MAAQSGLAGVIRVAWRNPDIMTLGAIEIWASQTNDRATATLVHTQAESAPMANRDDAWLHTGLVVGETWYYWLRSVARNGRLSTFFPEDAMAGWSAVVGGAASVPAYVTTFTDATEVTVTGATHGFGTADLQVLLYDTGTPRRVLHNVDMTIDAATFDVVLAFNVAQSGRLLIRPA